MSVTVGQTAPSFTLYDTEKQQVSLESFRGRPVVLLFYPQAFTGTCTAELCATRDDIGSYDKVQAQVLAISVDSVFTLKKFKDDQQFNFPLLSDFNKETSRAYGALYEQWILDMQGVSKRSAFVIDAAGVIRYAEVLENPGELPDFEAIKSTLASLS
ncbi:MAG TPA: redoxin domain-containing protein [Chitinophagales bacterium]|nr:redoxin domain-containing protein [Chitinophagales bacterium]HAE13668.1 peroxiredoxin [Bacteroidota bacterium]MCB9018980.1 redoxin domain-containing protein [Chitinophagales bacterium]MCB9032109.1 redoxin domain-containing protein [Chitinophagales bacterium]HAE35223.1 peroxiredoxin [Bacteroidota bacterium]